MKIALHIANIASRALLSAFILCLAADYCGASDVRLAQNVTYQGGYKRLHAVAEELSKQTGVTIRAGTSKQDWRVRDIPMVVCVKDMPLGTLLKTVADCAHASLTKDEIGNTPSEKPTYRICRTREQESSISSAVASRAKASRQLAEWTWDTLTAYADMPDATAQIKAGPAFDAAQIRAVAQALKALGGQARTRVLTDETVVEEIGANAKVAAFKNIYDYAATHASASAGNIYGWPDPPTIGVSMDESQSHGPAEMKIVLCDIHPLLPKPQSIPADLPPALAGPTDGNAIWHIAPSSLARAVAAVKKLNLPAEPDVKSAFADDDPFPENGFLALKSEDDWKARALQRKVMVKWPDGSCRPADALVALAKTGGMNIICEDFASHSPEVGSRTNITGNVETTPAAIVKPAFRHAEQQERWFLSGDGKLVVGWVADWPVTHQALIPESLFQSIMAKMDGDGAELDDIMPLLELSPAQLRLWFGAQGDMWNDATCGSLLWAARKLYNAVDADQKSAAKSDAGLPLADPLVDLISRERKAYDSHSTRLHKPGGSAELEAALASPSAATSLSFRVISEPAKSSPDRHVYSAALSVQSGREIRDLWRERLFNSSFPLLSPQRQSMLRRKALSNPAGKNH